MMAFYAGAIGIVIASYGNQVISQMPSIIFISISLAFLFYAPAWDKEIMKENEEKEKQLELRKERSSP
jgi:hypothetical protein